MSKPTASTVGVGSPYDLTAGSAWYAPADTATVPTDATTSLGSEFACLGHLTTDGVTISESRSTTNLTAWGNVKIRTVTTEDTHEMGFTPIQTADYDVAVFAYGEDNVTQDETTGALAIDHNADDVPEWCVVVELLVAPELKERIVAERCQVTNRGDMTFDGGSYSGREITLGLNAGADGKTDFHEYFAAVSE